MRDTPNVLITGASSGIGATYADRFARRGHDLVLVARDAARLAALAERLRAETGVAVDVLRADLTAEADLVQVEARLREDARIGVLVNNAGAAGHGGLPRSGSPRRPRRSSRSNVTRADPARPARSPPRFVEAGAGAIVNIGSVVGLAPEFGMAVYGADQGVHAVPEPGPAARTRPEGRLRPGRPAGRHPDRDLGALRGAT